LLFLFIGLGASPARAQANANVIASISGQVTVNGRPAAVGDTISSGAVVETAARSSAVVSLGKLGRVEVTEETKMTITFDDDSITILLSRGTVKVLAKAKVDVAITRGS
jgi:hypothetical protein